jgi:hypothetical protein
MRAAWCDAQPGAPLLVAMAAQADSSVAPVRDRHRPAQLQLCRIGVVKPRTSQPRSGWWAVSASRSRSCAARGAARSASARQPNASDHTRRQWIWLGATQQCERGIEPEVSLTGSFVRARPPMGGMLGAPVFDYSFPSGHTTSGTVLYVLAAMLLVHTETRNTSRRLLVAAGCVLGGLIGLSRVYLGYHWLTDVVGSWVSRRLQRASRWYSSPPPSARIRTLWCMTLSLGVMLSLGLLAFWSVTSSPDRWYASDGSFGRARCPEGLVLLGISPRQRRLTDRAGEGTRTPNHLLTSSLCGGLRAWESPTRSGQCERGWQWPFMVVGVTLGSAGPPRFPSWRLDVPDWLPAAGATVGWSGDTRRNGTNGGS